MTKQHAYITTAIPYVNGLPHIGHAMDYMLADVWARYARQNGREVRFQTGVDEHGNKIAAKAAENNLTPQAYVDQLYENFKKMIAELNISYSSFPYDERENQYKYFLPFLYNTFHYLTPS